MYENPNLIVESNKVKAGSITWKCPSNIALIKYWGKHGVQLPNNPSISFTLSKANTRTTLKYSIKETSSAEMEVKLLFHGVENPVFEEKVKIYFQKLLPYFPFLSQLKFEIETENSFPHSAGIASSASAMGALSLCVCSLEEKLFLARKSDAAFDQKASFMARLGSGSASRSIKPKIGIWGKSFLDLSDDNYAIQYTERIKEQFLNFHDAILIISDGEKSVSSTKGHQLMEGNPYATVRYKQANTNLKNLVQAMQTGDMDSFIAIVEKEALTLHALMMASPTPFLLMDPNTVAVIKKVWAFRKTSGLPICFTLDAGPNIHLLYPDEIKAQAIKFIEEELKPLCHQERVIYDKVGNGPEQI